MGGLWIHPIKLVDGFWAAVRDASSGREVGRPRASSSSPTPTALGSDIAGARRRRDRAVRVQPRRTARRHRPIPAHQHDRSREAPRALPHHQNRSETGVVLREDRHHRRARQRRAGSRPSACSWGGTPGMSGTSCGAPRTPARHDRASPCRREPPRRHATPCRSARGRAASLTFIFAGSAASEAEALGTYRRLAADRARLLEGKKRRYAALLEPGARSDPRPSAAGGLRLGSGEHAVAGPGRTGDRTRARRRADGVSLVVRHRDATPSRPSSATGDFELAKQTLRLLRRSVGQDQRQRPDRPRGHHHGGGVQSGQHPGDRAVHHDRRQGGRVERRPGASPGRCIPR